jgi:hypothetical protein
MVMVSMLFASNDNVKIDKYYKDLYNLNDEQIYNMIFSYAMGNKDGNDLGLTLAAIAWKESLFGKYSINLADGKHGSFGMYQIVLDYAAIRNNIKTIWAKSRLAESLLRDKAFAAEEAIAVLKYFMNRNGCSWRCGVASYNAGFSGLKSKEGREYAHDILLRVKALDRKFTNLSLYGKLNSLVIDM